jgi:hypothetical protein
MVPMKAYLVFPTILFLASAAPTTPVDAYHVLQRRAECMDDWEPKYFGIVRIYPIVLATLISCLLRADCIVFRLVTPLYASMNSLLRGIHPAKPVTALYFVYTDLQWLRDIVGFPLLRGLLHSLLGTFTFIPTVQIMN